MVEPGQKAPIRAQDNPGYYDTYTSELTGERHPDEGAKLGSALGAAIANSSTKMSWLELNGEFGAVKIYMSPQRRDELYSLIRSHVEMGIPVAQA